MADSQPENLGKLLCTPAFGSYDNIMANHITNEATGQVFNMDKLGMMDVKTLNSVFSEYNKKARANAPRFLVIKIQQFLAFHRHMQGKFLHGQAVTASILTILYNIKQDYTAVSDVIVAEDKDAKSTIVPVVFNSSDKVIPLLAYWVVVLVSMNSFIDQFKLDYLLRGRCRYTPAQRSALAVDSFKDSVANIAMTGSACTDNNARAYDALIPGIFVPLAEQVLTATIKNEKYFLGSYYAF